MPARRPADTLVAVLDIAHVAWCFEHLADITDGAPGKVVVVVPHRFPRWWVLAVTMGFAPTGIDDRDLSRSERLLVDRLLERHPEHDGVDVRFLPPPLDGGVGSLLRGPGMARLVIVAGGRRRASRRAEQLRRAVSSLCDVAVVAP